MAEDFTPPGVTTAEVKAKQNDFAPPPLTSTPDPFEGMSSLELRETFRPPSITGSVLKEGTGLAVEPPRSNLPPSMAPGAYTRGGTFTRSVSRGIEQTQGLYGQFIKELGESTGFSSLVEVGDELVQEAFVEAITNPPQVVGLEDLRWSNAGTFVLQTLGEQMFNIGVAGAAAMVAGPGTTLGLRGALMRAGLARNAANALARRAALKRSAAGTFGAFLPINTGEIIQEQRDAGLDPDLLSSLVLGVPSSALEVAGFAGTLAPLFRGVSHEIAGTAIKNVVKRLGYASLSGIASEGGTEAAQEALVIASQALKDPTFSVQDAILSSEGLSRLAFAGISGATVGGVLGGAGGGVNAVTGRIRASRLNSSIDRLRGGLDQLANTNENNPEHKLSLFDAAAAKRYVVDKVKTLGEQTNAFIREQRSNIEAGVNEGTLQGNLAALRGKIETKLSEIGAEAATVEDSKSLLQQTLNGISELTSKAREALAEIPSIDQQRKGTGEGTAARKAGDAARQLLTEINKLNPSEQVTKLSEAVELIRKQIADGLRSPASINRRALKKLIDKVESVGKKAKPVLQRQFNELDRSLDVNRTRLANLLDSLPEVTVTAEEALTETANRAQTAAEEVIAGLDAMLKGTKKSVTAVGWKVSALYKDKAIAKKLAEVAKKLFPGGVPTNMRNGEVIIGDMADADTSNTTDIRDIPADEETVIVRTSDEQGRVINQEVTPKSKAAEVVEKKKRQYKAEGYDDVDMFLRSDDGQRWFDNENDRSKGSFGKLKKNKIRERASRSQAFKVWQRNNTAKEVAEDNQRLRAKEEPHQTREKPRQAAPKTLVPKIERPRTWIRRSDVRQNRDKIYVFGDNDQRKGLGGQARAMRGEKNAIGVRTKKAPNNNSGSFYTDAEFAENKKKIDEDFNKVLKAVRAGKTIVIPADGLGTGRARLGPKTLAYINEWINRITAEAGEATTVQSPMTPEMQKEAQEVVDRLNRKLDEVNKQEQATASDPNVVATKLAIELSNIEAELANRNEAKSPDKAVNEKYEGMTFEELEQFRDELRAEQRDLESLTFRSEAAPPRDQRAPQQAPQRTRSTSREEFQAEQRKKANQEFKPEQKFELTPPPGRAGKEKRSPYGRVKVEVLPSSDAVYDTTNQRIQEVRNKSVRLALEYGHAGLRYLSDFYKLVTNDKWVSVRAIPNSTQVFTNSGITWGAFKRLYSDAEELASIFAAMKTYFADPEAFELSEASDRLKQDVQDMNDYIETSMADNIDLDEFFGLVRNAEKQEDNYAYYVPAGNNKLVLVEVFINEDGSRSVRRVDGQKIPERTRSQVEKNARTPRNRQQFPKGTEILVEEVGGIPVVRAVFQDEVGSFRFARQILKARERGNKAKDSYNNRYVASATRMVEVPTNDLKAVRQEIRRRREQDSYDQGFSPRYKDLSWDELQALETKMEQDPANRKQEKETTWFHLGEITILGEMR